MSVISRATMAAGERFAPGHLGELTQQVPFEMVDAVLEETRRVQRRVRVLPGPAQRDRRRRRDRPGRRPRQGQLHDRLNAARDQVILAAGVTPGPAIDLAGAIGRALMASLMPARRPRTSPRVVKRALSKYNARCAIDRTTRKAAIGIAIIAAPLTGAAPLN
jgi:hypothetical protein